MKKSKHTHTLMIMITFSFLMLVLKVKHLLNSKFYCILFSQELTKIFSTGHQEDIAKGWEVNGIFIIPY